jgi:hypothetical protein
MGCKLTAHLFGHAPPPRTPEADRKLLHRANHNHDHNAHSNGLRCGLRQ